MSYSSKNALDLEIKFLKGVGERRALLLKKLNIFTIADLLEYFPRDYIDRKASTSISELYPGERRAIIGTVVDIQKKSFGRGGGQLNVIVSDGDDHLICTWFRVGKWLTDQFKEDQRIWVSGIVTEFMGTRQFVHPEFEVLDATEHENFWHSRQVLPVYGLTDGIKMGTLRNLVYKAFELYHDKIEESLPQHLLDKYQFENRKVALQKMHFSQHPAELNKVKQRFIFEELFYIQLMLARTQQNHHKKNRGLKFDLKRTYTSALKESLPFEMTGAQKRVIREFVQDMTGDSQMNRLLQGDVGSGKTIVTIFAMLLALENGYQSVMMAPTEILAEQHFLSLKNFFDKMPDIRFALLKGGNYKGKKKLKEEIAAGEVDIVVGTHALIQKDVFFKKLGFIAIDEQHRFGVEQRAVLARKNGNPHLMYLSATPIPRSLALTVYGDLDVSIIDELPPNRKSIDTFWRGEKKRQEVYREVRDELAKGRQVYIVCPLIAESEKIDLLAAETLFEEISNNIYKDFDCSLLHGKMKAAEKDEIMTRFKAGEFQVLVSTTVIEVGIDVPNSTVMIIEHAERFGLSQLHQLRGRVGRGSEQSYCYLIGYQPISQDGKERLSIMVETNDGFKIAEKDLEIRGPGNFFGTEQSGMPEFKHANIVRDRELLIQARTLAFDLIEEDYNLEKPENIVLAKRYYQDYLKREKLFDY